MGQNAIAHNAEPANTLESRRGARFQHHRKGSLLPEGTTMEIVNLTAMSKQTVAGSARATCRTQQPAQTAENADQVQIIPASVELKAKTTSIRKQPRRRRSPRWRPPGPRSRNPSS